MRPCDQCRHKRSPGNSSDCSDEALAVLQITSSSSSREAVSEAEQADEALADAKSNGWNRKVCRFHRKTRPCDLCKYKRDARQSKKFTDMVNHDPDCVSTGGLQIGMPRMEVMPRSQVTPRLERLAGHEPRHNASASSSQAYSEAPEKQDAKFEHYRRFSL